MRSGINGFVERLAESEVASVLLDTDLRIQQFTDTAASLAALRPEDVGRDIGEFEPRLGGDHLIVDCEAALGTGKVCGRVVSDGSRHYLRRAWPNREPGGRVSGLVLSLIDVTELERAEELLLEERGRLRRGVRERTAQLELANRMLRESLARTEAILDTVADAVITIDESGIIVSTNAATREVFGYPEGELVGCDVKVLMPSPFSDEHGSRVARFVETGSPDIIGRSREVECQRKDGSHFPAELRLGEVKLGSGRLFTGVLRDLTERVRAQESLRASQERLRRSERLASVGTLAAGIAHEINNPVGTILLGASHALETLARKPDLAAGIPGIETSLQEIVEDAERCGAIVKSVLQFSRQQSSEKWPGDVNDRIAQVVDMLRADAERREVSIEMDLAAALPEVRMNPTEIEQVLVNLIRNAIEASDRPGVRIVVRSAACGDGVLVSVEDDGPGMSDDARIHLFDPFFTTRRERGGTGLGLSISHGIASDHGGTLDVESRLGLGTTVTLTLPAGEDGPPR